MRDRPKNIQLKKDNPSDYPEKLEKCQEELTLAVTRLEIAEFQAKHDAEDYEAEINTLRGELDQATES